MLSSAGSRQEAVELRERSRWPPPEPMPLEGVVGAGDPVSAPISWPMRRPGVVLTGDPDDLEALALGHPEVVINAL